MKTCCNTCLRLLGWNHQLLTVGQTSETKLVCGQGWLGLNDCRLAALLLWKPIKVTDNKSQKLQMAARGIACDHALGGRGYAPHQHVAELLEAKLGPVLFQ